MIDLPVDFFFCGVMQLKRQGNVVKNRTRTQQIEMLENHADFRADRSELLSVEFIEFLTVDCNRALCRPIQKVNGSHQRRFAGAGSTDNAEDFPFINV